MVRLGGVSALIKTVVLTSLMVTVPIVVVRSLGGFEAVELGGYDGFMRHRAAELMDDRITIVTISDEDIEQLQQYPIHDGTFAQALQILESYQPAAIGLDISRDVPHGPGAGRQRLTEVINSSKTIVSGCLLSSQEHNGSPPAPGTPEGGAAAADFPPDNDGTVRRTFLFTTPGKSNRPIRVNHICNDARPENEIPSLSFALATMYLANQNINPEPNARGEIQLGKQVLHRIDPNFGSYIHADVPDYQMMLNYRGAKAVFREISILDVLQKKVPADWVRDRVILIGNTSNVSKDFLTTPFIKTQHGLRYMHGVFVHGHAVSQILSAVLNQRPLISSWPEIGEIFWIWAWSLGSGFLAFYNRRLGLFMLGVVGLGMALVGVSYGLFAAPGVWIPWVPTLTGVILTALGVRLADLAQRSGYAQALYEQIREQIRVGSRPRDRRGDYLENLVHRARAIRQGEDAATLVSLGMEPDANASPAMQALYEQMETRVRQELAAEQFAQQRGAAQMGNKASKANRMQSLLNRAQQTRSESKTNNPPPPENPHA